MLALYAFHSTRAQVPVGEEPHHQVIFENQNIRLINLTIPPGDTTLSHTHTFGSVVIFLSKSAFAILDHGHQPLVTNVNPGHTVYRNYGERPAVHKVWSADQSTFRCLVIEIKRRNLSGNKCSPLPDSAGLHLLWQQESVNAYQLDFSGGEKLACPKSTCSYLIINIAGTSETVSAATKRSLKVGDFVFSPPQNAAEIRALDNGAAKSILLQLK